MRTLPPVAGCRLDNTRIKVDNDLMATFLYSKMTVPEAKLSDVTGVYIYEYVFTEWQH